MNWPAIEPELPPLSERRSFHVISLLAVLAVAVTAVVVVVVRSGGGSEHVAKTRPLPAPGRLLAYDDKTGHLVIELPDGRHRKVDKQLLTDHPTASPDGGYVLTANGADLFSIAGGRITRQHTPLPSMGSLGAIPGQPFADHDRWLLSPTRYGGSNTLTLVPRAGGPGRFLGTGDNVSADPVAPGVYTSVPKGHPVSLPDNPQIQVRPDVRVEHRVVGKPARTIATAAQLDSLAGLPRSVKLFISAGPSPHGRYLLIYARALDGNTARTLLAVFDQHGRLVDRVTARHITGGDWSPDDKRIAYQTGSSRLTIWQPAANHATTIDVPAVATWYYECAWSPNGDWLACAGGRDPLTSGPTRRLVVDVAHRRAQSMPAGDSPLIWLPSPGRA